MLRPRAGLFLISQSRQEKILSENDYIMASLQILLQFAKHTCNIAKPMARQIFVKLTALQICQLKYRLSQ